MQKGWQARYPGDKDGMARFCINTQIPLRQDLLLKLVQLAAQGFQNEGQRVHGPTEGEEGPVFQVVFLDGQGRAPRLVSIPIIAAGLQAIFNPRRKVNHNLRNRLFTALFTDWGGNFLDTHACVWLVRLGWGEDAQ